jgi:hypothetical protein
MADSALHHESLGNADGADASKVRYQLRTQTAEREPEC